MFGVDSTELVIVAIAALLFIGPKDLPRAMRVVGQWVGKIRGTARHFQMGIQNMMREAELEEMERKWREEDARVMRDHPAAEDDPSAAYDDADGAQALLPLEPPPGDLPGETHAAGTRPLP